MAGILDGKVAIVTGAGRGLGRTHALALANEGATVLVNDLGGSGEGFGSDPDPAAKVAQEIIARGGRAFANNDDISDWDGARSLVETAVERFGALDIVVNNAGVFSYSTIDTIARETWERTIAVNLTGTAAICHWAAVHWRARGPAPGRAIVNTSSPAGTHPTSGSPDYCASKAGVAALTMSCAMELAELGIRVNALAPMARTRLTEKVVVFKDIMKPSTGGFDRRAPDHISQVVVYLASPLCKFTGRIFGAEADEVYLYDGYSANTHANNNGMPWSAQSLQNALTNVPSQDRGYAIATDLRYPGPHPSDDVLNALEAVARGEEVSLTPLLVTD